MKHFTIPLALAAIIAASCSVKDDRLACTVPVSIHVNAFSVTQEGASRTKAPQDPAAYGNVKAMDLAFFGPDGTKMFAATQLKDDSSTYDTFGEFSCRLPVGAYTMVVIARYVGNGDVFTLTSPTEASFSDKPRETFVTTQEVSVTEDAPLDLDVTLNRIVSYLNVISTDGRPAEATKMRVSFSKGGKDFNPSTGLALSDAGFSQVFNPSAAVGTTINVSACPFLITDEETMTVTLSALDASDNVLITKTVPNVPFKRNRTTILTGAVYTPGVSTAGFQLETEWLDSETVNF